MNIEGYKKKKVSVKNVILLGITSISIGVVLIGVFAIAEYLPMPMVMAFAGSCAWLVSFSHVNAGRL